MAIGDIKQRAIVELTLDATKYKDAARQVKSSADDTKRAIETIGIEAAQTETKLERMVNATRGGFGNLSKGFGDTLGGVKRMADGLGKLNPAVELLGKGFDFAKAGLDAYGKTSKEAQAKVEALSKEFGGLKDEMLAMTGQAVVALLEPMEMTDKWLKKATALHDKVHGLSALNLAPLLAQLKQIEVAYDANQKLRAEMNADAAAALAGARAAAVSSRRPPEVRTPREQDVSELVSVTGTDTVGPMLGFSTQPIGVKADTRQVNEYGAEQTEGDQLRRMREASEQADILAAALAKVKTTVESVKGQTLLERLGLQDPEPFTLATAAAIAFGSAWQSSLAAVAEGSMSTAEIFKKGLGAVIKGVGDQLAALGAAEFVKGAAMLITLNPKGFLHLGAGSLYSAGAVAAYAASSKLGGGGGSAPSKPSASAGGAAASGGGSSAGGSSGSSGSNERPTPERPVYILMGSDFAEDSPRMRSIRARDAMDRALRERDDS